MDNPDKTREKPLRGAIAISGTAGLTPRQTYDQLERGLLPGFKRGRIWYAFPSDIARFYRELGDGALERCRRKVEARS
jgi:hypothetical protein